MFSMFVSCMFVLKYSFNTVFINIYLQHTSMSKTFCQVKLEDIPHKLFYLEDRYFPPPWYIHLLCFFSEKYIFSSSAEESELIQ